MYARVQKRAKLGKRVLVILTNFEKNMMHKLRKTHAKAPGQKRVFRVYFHT